MISSRAAGERAIIEPVRRVALPTNASCPYGVTSTCGAISAWMRSIRPEGARVINDCVSVLLQIIRDLFGGGGGRQMQQGHERLLVRVGRYK